MISTLKSILASLVKSSHHLSNSNQQQFIFLLGHMRSGSTLLQHLLISHPQICGLGERNLAYKNENDLWKLVARCRWKYQKPFYKYSFFIDQINHNHLTPTIDLLKMDTVKIIFLLRKPDASISSLLRLSEKYYDGKWTPESATDYYVNRLQFLQRSMQKLDNSTYWLVQYEGLIHHSEKVLSQIADFLNLNSPIQQTYKTFDFTGKKGDPSQKIDFGKIKTTTSPLLKINADLLEKANQAYVDLLKSCS